MFALSAIYECMCEVIVVPSACDWSWNLIAECKAKSRPSNDEYAQIVTMQPLEMQLKNIAQMFWRIKSQALFYTSPVSVCLFGGAPVVQMCMKKMNHHRHLTYSNTQNNPAKINSWYHVHSCCSIMNWQYSRQNSKKKRKKRTWRVWWWVSFAV